MSDVIQGLMMAALWREAQLKTPRYRFSQHCNNALKRGLEFKLTFEQWWNIWQDSGHWEQRGQGADKYCMCRVGDVGPYAIDNVFIATNGENVRTQGASNKTLPIGVRQSVTGKNYFVRKMLKGVQYHVGTFPTPELARKAYENFTV